MEWGCSGLTVLSSYKSSFVHSSSDGMLRRDTKNLSDLDHLRSKSHMRTAAIFQRTGPLRCQSLVPVIDPFTRCHLLQRCQCQACLPESLLNRPVFGVRAGVNRLPALVE